jgi:two-component system NtrC family sensor kinase
MKTGNRLFPNFNLNKGLKMDIIIADDDKTSRSVLEKMLKKAGHNVFLAENGVEAWGLIKKGSIQMLITDWEMPGMSGIELCSKIRSENLSNYIYVVIVTSRDQKSDAVMGLEAGADEFLVKPVHLEELSARIRSGQRIIMLEEEKKKTNTQLLQSEKMASVGQLAAGVAHEINNPTGFVSSNIKTLSDYYKDISKLIEHYKALAQTSKSLSCDDPIKTKLSEIVNEIENYEKEIDIDFIMDDISELMEDCKEGTDRIKKIVIDLKDFAYPGEDELTVADINNCLESTLNVVWSELKYKATVIKDLGELSPVMCYPHQLNQVFMNILVNAAQAIEKKGEIKVSTFADNGFVKIQISDNGSGISEENISKIFDPFFTTKEVGKGTGLGMNVAYNIIEKHDGRIDVSSKAGEGTTFTVTIPVEREK